MPSVHFQDTFLFTCHLYTYFHFSRILCIYMPSAHFQNTFLFTCHLYTYFHFSRILCIYMPSAQFQDTLYTHAICSFPGYFFFTCRQFISRIFCIHMSSAYFYFSIDSLYPRVICSFPGYFVIPTPFVILKDTILSRIPTRLFLDSC